MFAQKVRSGVGSELQMRDSRGKEGWLQRRGVLALPPYNDITVARTSDNERHRH